LKESQRIVALTFGQIVSIPFQSIDPLSFPSEQLLIRVRYYVSKQKIGFLRIAQFSPSKRAVDMIDRRVRSSPPEMRALHSGVLPSLNNKTCPSN